MVGLSLTSDAALREHARKWLPRFMIPNQFVILEALPLNSNGKIDRCRLPEPPAPATQRRLEDLLRRVRACRRKK